MIDFISLQQDAELRLLPPLQVAAFDALSAENKARLKSQATLHCEAIEHLQQQHEREKQADRENLQQQVNELIRLRGEVKRLNNVVLTNSARSGEFLEVRRTSLLHRFDIYSHNSRLRHKMYHMLQPQLYTAPIRTRVLCGNPRICWHVFSASFLVEQAQFVHVVTCVCLCCLFLNHSKLSICWRTCIIVPSAACLVLQGTENMMPVFHQTDYVQHDFD